MRSVSGEVRAILRRAADAVRRLAAGAAVGAAVVQPPPAIPLDPPMPAAGNPLAPRGGVIAIPLELPAAGRSVPTRVPIRIGEGEQAIEVEGRVGWLVEWGPGLVRRWTDAANPLRVVEVADGIDPRTVLDPAAEPPRERIVGAILLAEVPAIVGEPSITVGDRRVSPRWFDPAPPLPPFAPPSERIADDEPDPTSPTEWFRHAIRSDLSGEPPPGPAGDAAANLFARHVADVWRGGIARIEPHAPVVARELRERLVSIAVDLGSAGSRGFAEPNRGGPRIAAWLAATDELNAALTILHDSERDDAAIATSIGAWLEVNAPIAAWLDGDSGGTVRVTFLNGCSEDRALICSWIGAGDGLPVAAYLPGRSLRTVSFQRPPGAPPRTRPTGEGAEPLVLWMRGDGFDRRITVPHAATPAKPPTLNLGAFAAPFTLAEAKAGVASRASSRFATSATVRRRGMRWEALVECRRDGAIAADDRIVLEWGGRRLEVDATGASRIADSEGAPPETSVAAGPDRWRVRIAFPDRWIPEASPAGVVVSLGLVRVAGEARRSAIVPQPAFRTGLSPVEIDLSTWGGR